MPNKQPFPNPYRAGAGLPPPHLAGREKETAAFTALLGQQSVTRNLVLTGLRGTGKTVLLDSWKPVAISEKWLWAGADLSESASVSEATMAIRLLTDLSIVTSQLLKGKKGKPGFNGDADETSLDYQTLLQYFSSQPGLVSDQLRGTLEFVWAHIQNAPNIKGIVFAYDEAQLMSDKKEDGQYPLSVLLEVFQSLQKRGYPFLLVLTGLPTIQQRLVEARTYSERMFDIVKLGSLSAEESRDAILKPLNSCPVKFNDFSIELLISESGGYPYFVQFLCRESFDSFLSQMAQGIEEPSVPMNEIIAKLDIDFFAARWARASDRERELLTLVSNMESSQKEFTIKEAEEAAKVLESPMTNNNISQMFIKLMNEGMVYRPRYGKYAFGIPMLREFIKRQKLFE